MRVPGTALDLCGEPRLLEERSLVVRVDQAERLAEVAAGTPMGELLRRYWHPVAAVTGLDARPTKPVRLLGEDLVLFRDLSGTYGLVERLCPHRGADLGYGSTEHQGIRCSYHGWLFDYPHADSTWPHSGKLFREQLGHLDQAEPRKVLLGNAERTFHFRAPTVVSTP